MASRINLFNRMFTILITGLAILSVNPAMGQESNRNSGKYLIHAGDVLEISVWREEYLERAVVVQPDGRISFPLAGALEAAGKSVSELQVNVAEKLALYFPDPVVTVSIKEIRGNTVYILGQVQNPGQIVMNPVIVYFSNINSITGSEKTLKLQ